MSFSGTPCTAVPTTTSRVCQTGSSPPCWKRASRRPRRMSLHSMDHRVNRFDRSWSTPRLPAPGVISSSPEPVVRSAEHSERLGIWTLRRNIPSRPRTARARPGCPRPPMRGRCAGRTLDRSDSHTTDCTICSFGGQFQKSATDDVGVFRVAVAFGMSRDARLTHPLVR
jgi:hypothetical protein